MVDWSLLWTEPGQLNGLRVTKLTSTKAQIKWNRLSCHQYNGIAVGYMYELSRYLQRSHPAVNVMFGIVNGTTLDFNDLVPFMNYTVSVRFTNHKYRGPQSMLDFVTFEDREYLLSLAALFRANSRIFIYCSYVCSCLGTTALGHVLQVVDGGRPLPGNSDRLC